jgi:hypothetical protein
MLKFLFGFQSALDPALGDPLANAVMNEAKRGKIDTLLTKVDALRSGEWDRRMFYADLAGDWLTSDQNIEMLPDVAIGNLVRGSAAIKRAWKARGGGQADTVSESGANQFFKHLDFAGKQLIRAAEQDPEDPTAFAFLQTVAMGLQLDRRLAQDWFDEAVRRDPVNQQAHIRRLTLLCEKWGGSHAEMYAFARSTMEKVPPTSTLHPSILYYAFQEHYLYFKAFDKDMAGAKAFLQDQSIREESVTVYNRSLRQRQRIERVSDYWPHNVTVWWFWMLKMREIVRLETKKIGPHLTKYPWAMFYKSPIIAYQNVARL